MTESSPLLALLDQRWNDDIKHIPDPTPDKPYKPPQFNEGEKLAVLRTSRFYAEAHNSDPHAFALCRHYLTQGLWNMDEVERECRGLISSRKAQGILFPVARRLAA